eukprot:9500207-Alexandrium_andersonii.AAC.1
MVEPPAGAPCLEFQPLLRLAVKLRTRNTLRVQYARDTQAFARHIPSTRSSHRRLNSQLAAN